jgi:hypothetical protein
VAHNLPAPGRLHFAGGFFGLMNCNEKAVEQNAALTATCENYAGGINFPIKFRRLLQKTFGDKLF